MQAPLPRRSTRRRTPISMSVRSRVAPVLSASAVFVTSGHRGGPGDRCAADVTIAACATKVTAA